MLIETFSNIYNTKLVTLNTILNLIICLFCIEILLFFYSLIGKSQNGLQDETDIVHYKGKC